MLCWTLLHLGLVVLSTGVSCGASPVVPNASANKSSGVFGDVIEYECSMGYADNTGNVGRMTCNSSALWDPDSSLGAPPDCQGVYHLQLFSYNRRVII